MRLLLWVLKWIGLSLSFISKLVGKGRGTAITGWLVEHIAPWSLTALQQDYSSIIYISGTNGKTTTRSLIRHVLSQLNFDLVTNSGGANIMRGVAGSMLQEFKLVNKKKKVLLLEVEEATLPKLSKLIRPNYIVLTNLFRDQLDVYGDIDTTKHYFIESINQLLPGGTVIINGQDPMLTSLTSDFTIKTFGISVPSMSVKFEGATNLQNVDLLVSKEKKSILVNQKHPIDLLLLQGDYNLYNVSAALLVCQELGVGLIESTRLVSTFNTVFGRGEIIQLGGCELQLNLIKNPAGAELVLASLPTIGPQDMICFIMNDNIADGKDVSWFWDIPMENYFQRFANSTIYCSGSRKEDMKVRLKVSGIISNIICLESETILTEIKTKKPKSVIILATYTAMMEIRKQLSKLIKLPSIDDERN
jgi:lipid II isoglutaminyl synthase (glutamine-hydrolysing)